MKKLNYCSIVLTDHKRTYNTRKNYHTFIRQKMFRKIPIELLLQA